MKRGLLFGCNYAATDYALGGCINDVTEISRWLVARGYAVKYIVDDGSTPSRPTRATILKELSDLITTSRQGDQLFIHFSGHGGQDPDLDGDEVDHQDELIYGSSESTLEPIRDDELRVIIDAAPHGVKIRCIFDCCHSASALDLPYRHIRDEWFLTESSPLKGSDDVIELSGCRDDQQSADAFIGGRYQGALTHTFLQVVQSHPKMTWGELVDEIRTRLAPRYTQVPQLSMGNPKLESTPMDV